MNYMGMLNELNIIFMMAGGDPEYQKEMEKIPDLRVVNNSGWMYTTIVEGDDCIVSLEWTSILEDGTPTGDGVLDVTGADYSIITTFTVKQGTVTINISGFLNSGKNIIGLRIIDSYGQYRWIHFSVYVLECHLVNTRRPIIIENEAVEKYEQFGESGDAE